MDAPGRAPESHHAQRSGAPGPARPTRYRRRIRAGWADMLTSKELRCLPRWVALCAALLLLTLLVTLVDAGSLAIWLSTRHSTTPMTLSELSGLAATWGLLTAAPWAGLIGAVVSSPLWARTETTAVCLCPLAVLVPVVVLRPASAALVCSAVIAALALSWLILTGMRRAYRPTPPGP